VLKSPKGRPVIQKAGEQKPSLCSYRVVVVETGSKVRVSLANSTTQNTHTRTPPR